MFVEWIMYSPIKDTWKISNLYWASICWSCIYFLVWTTLKCVTFTFKWVNNRFSNDIFVVSTGWVTESQSIVMDLCFSFLAFLFFPESHSGITSNSNSYDICWHIASHISTTLFYCTWPYCTQAFVVIHGYWKLVA